MMNKIGEQSKEVLEEIQEQEKNMNDIQLNYKEENILVERDIRENFGRLQSAEESGNNSNISNRNTNKNVNKEKNKKYLFTGLLGKIFKFSF